MAHIAIAAYGSRGDLLPLTDFGVRLLDRGHTVTMTTTGDLADDIAAVGLATRIVDFHLDGPDSPTDPEANPLRAAAQMVIPKGMRQLGTQLLAALDDVEADIVLLSPFAEPAGHAFAEARAIPSAGIRLQPMSTTAEFPPSLMGAWSAGRMLNRSAGRLAAATLDRLYDSTIRGFREQLGLPTASARRLRQARTAANWPILHGFSPHVVPRPADWRPGLAVTGYCGHTIVTTGSLTPPWPSSWRRVPRRSSSAWAV